jgi:Tfp pilus assembly protein FimV
MSTITIDQARVAPTHVAARPTQRPTPASALRLTRRGRVVVVLLGLTFALVAGIFLGAGSVATERPGAPEPTRIVQVGPGDTLWAIAADAAAATGEDDVRTMVDRIERLNALDGGLVLAGQRLRVPTD